ncbi:MAG: flagellar basal body L-ring protein FlgH [Gammaproteobacteria bacterium]|nr:flagellar basal body L-ring protein FlgH [Gammaproteobacteria bacterium]
MKMPTRLFMAALLLALLGGCQTQPTRDPAFAAARPEPQPAPAPTAGAIFSVAHTGPQFYDATLFTDTRARRVGDILTIQLVEQTTAEKESETIIEQETIFEDDNPTIFGGSPSIPRLPVVRNVLDAGEDRRFSLANSINSNREFEGLGETTQSNRIRGEITVTVAEVLPNGNLVIQGEKVMTLTRGNEYLRFSGIVRPMDVTADNTVPSTRVANSTIHYAGDGEVADSNVMGWLARFFVSALVPF